MRKFFAFLSVFAAVALCAAENFIKNACVTSAVDDFVADFETLCGKGKTMLNCEE